MKAPMLDALPIGTGLSTRRFRLLWALPTATQGTDFQPVRYQRAVWAIPGTAQGYSKYCLLGKYTVFKSHQ
jgi:hypothetical protein